MAPILALFGKAGNGAAPVEITAFEIDVRGLDPTSVARLLPSRVTAAEVATPVTTDLRSFSPADVAASAGASAGGGSSSFSSLQIGSRTYLTETIDGFWITCNATWDGAHWNRIDEARWAFGLNVRTAQPIPGEAATGGVIFWKTPPGANPINPVYTSADGWQNAWLFTEFGDVVVGGYGFEVDGNGTVPYGHLLQHSNGGATPHLTGLLTNLFLSLADSDDHSKPSWFAGFKDDSFVVARAAAGAFGAASLTTLLEVTSAGGLNIPASGGGTANFLRADGQWAAPSAGGSAAFGIITVSGQSNVVADAALDTLTLAGTNGVAITTNAATDTVALAPTYGTSANTICQGNDGRLFRRTPRATGPAARMRSASPSSAALPLASSPGGPPPAPAGWRRSRRRPT